MSLNRVSPIASYDQLVLGQLSMGLFLNTSRVLVPVV